MSTIAWRRKTKNVEHQQNLKRRVLLDAAAHAFTKNGYSSTSLDDLARLVDVTKPALYYYVKNKEDILLQCTEISLELIMAIFDEVNQPEISGFERLRRYFQRYAEICTGDYGYALIREGNKNLGPENKAKMRKIMRCGQDAVETLVKEGIEDGSIAPCHSKYVAYILFSTFNQMAFWFDSEGELTEAQIADQLLDIVAAGIEARK